MFVVAAAEVVTVIPIVPGITAAVDKNITVWTIRNCFSHSVHRHVAVVQIRPS